MAKALLGYVGGTGVAAQQQAQRLRQRVDELEARVLRLQAENDALAAAVHTDELLTIAETEAEYEPALS